MPKSCGECSACCVVFAVPQIRKPTNTPCRHLCANGCGIYNHPDKPKICSEYKCMWLANRMPAAIRKLFQSEDTRPDKLGVMFHWDGDIRLYELREGALNSEKVKALVWKIRKTGINAKVCRIPVGLPSVQQGGYIYNQLGYATKAHEVPITQYEGICQRRGVNCDKAPEELWHIAV